MIIQKHNGVILDLSVSPNQKVFLVEGFDEWSQTLKIKVRSLPIKGKANAEIERELRKFFQCPVILLKGLTSKHKKIKLEGKTAKEIKALLKSL